MAITNGEVWEAKPALATLLAERWPVKTSYALTKLARKIGAQYEIVKQVHDGLFSQYGELTEDGREILVKKDSPNWQPFALAMNELMATETDLDVQKVVLPEVDVLVTPATLMALTPFVEMA